MLPRRLLFGDDSSPRSLADVAARLERPITAAGYRLPRYLGAGCAGFAIVLDLERIEADGARRPGADGFAPPGQEESFSLASYIKRLFYAAPGLYRQIVFIVSEERLAGTTPAPTEAQLRALIRDGVSSLPPAFAKVPYAPTHEVTVLIYEFTKGPNAGDARLIPPRGRQVVQRLFRTRSRANKGCEPRPGRYVTCLAKGSHSMCRTTRPTATAVSVCRLSALTNVRPGIDTRAANSCADAT